MKEFSFHNPYGKSEFYGKTMEDSGSEKLTKLICICAMLQQTKVYPFWHNPSTLTVEDTKLSEVERYESDAEMGIEDKEY